MEEGKGMDSPCIAMNKPPKFGGKKEKPRFLNVLTWVRDLMGTALGRAGRTLSGTQDGDGSGENGSAWSPVWGQLGDSCDTGFGRVCTQGDGGVGATTRLAECWGSCEGVGPSVFFLEGLGWMQTPSCSKLPSPWCPQSSEKCSSESREGQSPFFALPAMALCCL